MRKFKQFMLLVMTVSLVTLTGCSSDDDSSDDGGGGSGGAEFLTAKIDGSNFAAAQDPAVIVGAQSVSGVLAVQGGDNSGNTINFALPNYNGVGTYNTGDSVTNTNFIQYLELNGGAPTTWASSFATSTPGTIVITSDDGTTVEGTFSFDGFDGSTTKAVTEGKFKALFDN